MDMYTRAECTHNGEGYTHFFFWHSVRNEQKRRYFMKITVLVPIWVGFYEKCRKVSF